ncbi:hypothetical protein [Arthrobacter sp. MYb213]|uniref:hypothetical protein n=1 Tax=Arthrobacter sp. MYb213 TaxID=1848595 RepID=UPI000CFC88E4|nr:hypothetical protein [Arthrobacter sp. MYb213]PRB69526.1 hypothetical protein CQ011_12245 [Arthrobacter sp. MYb213]
MPKVTGGLRSIAGGTLNSFIGKLVFRLNAPNVGVVGFSKSHVVNTMEWPVTPGTDGNWSVNLTANTVFANDSWYDVGIVWNETEGTFWDFGLRIRVPSDGGTFDELLDTTGTGQASNPFVVWVGETAPAERKGQWWFKPSTNKLYRWE